LGSCPSKYVHSGGLRIHVFRNIHVFSGLQSVAQGRQIIQESGDPGGVAFVNPPRRVVARKEPAKANELAANIAAIRQILIEAKLVDARRYAEMLKSHESGK
jgi:hypothetical protein